MKKILILFAAALVSLSLQNCGNGSDTNEPDPGGPGVVEDESSEQAETKTISVPAENFPAIDVYAGTEAVTSFTVLEGFYTALKNETEFNGDTFAKGVALGEYDVITIKQGGETLVQFAPKTGGAGTKIKILGLGSTSSLTASQGVGRGIYTFTAPQGAADANGMIKGGTIFIGGNANNAVSQITLEGGVDYLLRRDRLDLAIDVEGWAFQPADLGQGFVCENPNMLISIYPASAKDEAADNQVPLYSAQPLASSGQWDFILQRFVKVSSEPSDFFYRVQGNGNISCWFRIGDGCNYENYDFTSKGIPAEHGNQNPYARVFGPTIRFGLYVCDHTDDLADADLATTEQISAFLSDDGLDPGDNYVIMKVSNPEEAVNTLEEIELIWKRKAGKTNNIRFEGVAYDTQQESIVLTAGMTIRTL